MGTSRRSSLPLDTFLRPLKKLDLKRRWKRHSIAPASSIIEQTDIVSSLPYELAVQVFVRLDYADLVNCQLVCKTWYMIGSDYTIWRTKYMYLALTYPTLIPTLPGTHQPVDSTQWQNHCRRALRDLNWASGSVQSVDIIEGHNNRTIFSVKLKKGLLVTAGLDNSVKVWDVTTGKQRWSRTWDELVRCIDIVPELNMLVVAFNGCKCHIYDLTRGAFSDPVQILKGGNHNSFVPDSIAIDENHFVLAGRKPSVVFVWKWRRGTRVANRAFDSQMHAVHLQGSSVITLSRDGSFHTFNIDSNLVESSSFELPAAELPCFALDGLSMVCASTWPQRLFHFRFEQQLSTLTSVLEEKHIKKPASRLRSSMSLPSLIFRAHPQQQQHQTLQQLQSQQLPELTLTPPSSIDNTPRRRSLTRKFSPLGLDLNPSRPQPDLKRRPHLFHAIPLYGGDDNRVINGTDNVYVEEIVSLGFSSQARRIVTLGENGQLVVYADDGSYHAILHPAKQPSSKLDLPAWHDVVAGVTNDQDWSHWSLLAIDQERCVVAGRGAVVVLGFSPRS